MAKKYEHCLRFKEFDYESTKKQLPTEYEPLPYAPAKARIKRHAHLCVHGFSTETAALQFISQYTSFFPPRSFIIQKGPKSVLEYEYKVIAPFELFNFMRQNELRHTSIVVKATTYNDATIPPVLYRTIGEKNVNKLFERGELLLSTFKRCRELENDTRRDKYELRNIVEIHEGTKRMEVDVGFDDSLLVLCTSLPPINEGTDFSATIRITDISGFYKEITKTLVGMGFPVAEVLYGPCVYNDKVISIETDSFVSSLESKVQTTNNFPSRELAEFINSHAENSIIMNKPSKFMKEREFRFVWKLVCSFDDERLLIRNANLSKYCERMDTDISLKKQ